MLLSRFAFAGLLVLAAAAPAAAQSGYGRPYGVQLDRGAEVGELPTPFGGSDSCIPQCQFDTAPCDPIYYKLADRRCNYNKRG